MESWDRELLDEISFDDLKEVGAEIYMERVQKIHDDLVAEANAEADGEEEQVAYSDDEVGGKEKE